MPVGTPAPPTLRRQVERRSRPLLLRLHRWPRPVVPLVTVLLVLVGVLAPLAIGLVALGVVALLVGWMAYLSWPVVGASGRLVRVVMVTLVLAVALSRV